MKTVWKKRLKKTNEDFLKFSTRTDVEGMKGADYFLLPYEIEGTIAHVKTLIKQKIISKKIGEKIIKALKELDAEKINLNKYEDVHSAVEDYSIKKTGYTPHIARSRNDQVILDERLFIRDHTKKIINLISNTVKKLKKLSKKYSDVETPLYTHMQQAAVSNFGRLMDSYVKALERDKKRFEYFLKILDENPLGAVAVGGTNLPIDRKYTAKLLGFSKVQENTVEVVTNRWEFPANFLFFIVLTYQHLSTIARDIMYFNSLHVIEIGDEFCTGSSVMPHKKNPDFFELIVGKKNTSIGSLISVISSGGEFSGYTRITQEVKWNFINICIDFEKVLEILPKVLETIKPNKQKLEKMIDEDVKAMEIANKLALKKNISYREAYNKVADLIYKKHNKDKQ